MLYEAYERKMLKIKSIWDKILKFKFLILGVLCAILSVVTALMIFKGSISAPFKPQRQYVYGEEITCSAKTFMSKARFEFTGDGYRGWEERTPVYPGNYKVRTVGDASFNGKKYSEAFPFNIVKKSVDIELSSEVVYGENPIVTVQGLAYADELVDSELEFTFSNIISDQPKVKITGGELSFVNQKGEDVSSAYEYTGNFDSEYNIKFTKRDISIEFLGKSKVYDGKPLKNEKFEVVGELAFNDTVKVTDYDQITYFGSKENTGKVKIINPQGMDVTKYYSIKKSGELLNIDKKDLVIQALSAKHEYDMTEFSYHKYELLGNGIFSDEKIEVVSGSSITDVGEIDNDLTFKITKGDDDVTLSYNISTKPGKLEVTKRPITIKALTTTEIYNGEKFAVGAEVISNKGLLDGHYIECDVVQKLDNEIIDAIDVGEYVNEIASYKILFGEKDVTKNYSIKTEKGKLTIEKRPIKFVLIDKLKPFDTLPLTSDEYYIADDTSLAVGHEVTLTANGSITYPGTKLNKVTSVIIKDKNGDVTKNYNVSSVDGELRIVRREIFIAPLKYTKVYDGEKAVFPTGIDQTRNTYATWQNSENEIYGSPLYNGCIIKASIKIDDEIVNVGEGMSSIVSFDIIDASGQSVLKYYDAIPQMGRVEVKQRTIEISSRQLEKQFDDTPLIGAESDCYISKGTLVGGHYVKCTVEGFQFNAGESLNSITSVYVYDSRNNVIGFAKFNRNGEIIVGNSELMNYQITVKNGKLIVY